MMKAKCVLHNRVTIQITGKEGKVREEVVTTNITCIDGRTELLSRLADISNTADLGVAKYISIGDDNTTPTEDDATLGNELERAAILTAETVQTDTQMILYARIPVGSLRAFDEVGLHIGASATSSADTGALLARAVLGATVTKTADEAATIKWELNLNNYVS